MLDALLFDFASWYDQLALSPSVRRLFTPYSYLYPKEE